MMRYTLPPEVDEEELRLMREPPIDGWPYLHWLETGSTDANCQICAGDGCWFCEGEL